MPPTGPIHRALPDAAIQALTSESRVPNNPDNIIASVLVHVYSMKLLNILNDDLIRVDIFLPAVALGVPRRYYSSPSSCKDAEGAGFSESTSLSESLAACWLSSANS